MKFETAWIHFLSDLFAFVAVLAGWATFKGGGGGGGGGGLWGVYIGLEGISKLPHLQNLSHPTHNLWF